MHDHFYGRDGAPEAVKTIYGGQEMRSRLEARVAMAFDLIGLKWKYEPGVWELSEGRYMPDFGLYLPEDRHLFVEVKPWDFRTEPLDPRWVALARKTKTPIVVIYGAGCGTRSAFSSDREERSTPGMRLSNGFPWAKDAIECLRFGSKAVWAWETASDFCFERPAWYGAFDLD